MTTALRTKPQKGARHQAHVHQPTLTETLEAVQRGAWRGLRTLDRSVSQARMSIKLLAMLQVHSAPEVTPAILGRFIDASLCNCSPATLNVRLSALRALGVNVPGSHRAAPPRKWYLRPEDEDRLADCPGLLPVTRAFIAWTCATGLRVEESLRLRWRDMDRELSVVEVPGTKTLGSAAPLPLSEEARGVLMARAYGAIPSDIVFPIEYRALRAQWQIARTYLGYGDVPTATLKALRRSFARRAHLKGMPADVLRQYLRHGSLRTTMGYLHLVGGYSHEEMRRWL